MFQSANSKSVSSEVNQRFLNLFKVANDEVAATVHEYKSSSYTFGKRRISRAFGQHYARQLSELEGSQKKHESDLQTNVRVRSNEDFNDAMRHEDNSVSLPQLEFGTSTMIE